MKLASKHPLGFQFKMMLGKNWMGLWSLHEFGLTWEAALVSQGDAESTWALLAQIEDGQSHSTFAKDLSNTLGVHAGGLVLYEEDFTLLF